jgi:putative ABC transport system permease protein
VRQAVFIALGLALGVALVITVSAASAGVKKAEAGVLSGLYGVGTDMTVSGPSALTAQAHSCTPATTHPCSRPSGSPSKKSSNGEILFPPVFETVGASTVSAVARLHDVAAASGVLTLVYQSPQSGTDSVDGVGTGHTAVGPLSAARVVSGHFFTAADSGADVALVDSARSPGCCPATP